MVNKRTGNHVESLKPLSPVLLVSEKGTEEIACGSVTIDQVGEKGFGLSCLPSSWTPPFFVVSEKLLSLNKQSVPKKRKKLLALWSKRIISVALSIGIKSQDNIIIRSSAHSEGLDERGRYHSADGSLNNLPQTLNKYFEKIDSDTELDDHLIPLIIQKHISPVSAKGHLSNERRFYIEKRDWLVETEEVGPIENNTFEIHLRNWRERFNAEKYVASSLVCKLSAHIIKTLKIPAAWSYERNSRIHFEWVWDGKIIYLVQADVAPQTTGVNPEKTHTFNKVSPSEFEPKCLKKITKTHAKRFYKIRNVFTYKKLGLPISEFYILDDQSLIDKLASGRTISSLRSDIQELVKGSLVIRMDMATENLGKRQLLPRTEEVREFDKALDWLKYNSSEIKKNNIQDEVVFIFHNFVPAPASAFVYAEPGTRKVQIEALWGLPEGLYYNAHDKYIVDTKTPRLEDLLDRNITSYDLDKFCNFKRFFVSPDKSGKWVSKTLREPYDWKGTIQNDECLRRLALESRRIAEEEKRSLSIMWLIGVSIDGDSDTIVPWYHEDYDLKRNSHSPYHRTKTLFDKSLVIRTNRDIEILRQEAENDRSSVRRIRIQPQEECLLRNKDTLRDIGELSKKIDAVILLEGGILSHAYYQLNNTGANVEVVHPFRKSDDQREFNKLVRDNVPSIIERGGEAIETAKLSGEFLLTALKEKLIEEAFEVLDSVDQDSMIDELADVNEVINGILSHLGANRNELLKRQRKKREKAGGFNDGIVLLETRNLPPSQKSSGSDNTLFNSSNNQKRTPIDGRKIIELGHQIDRWTDRKVHTAETEELMRLVIPMVSDNWTSVAGSSSENSVPAKIKGTRLGSKLQIELSIFVQPKQLLLFGPENSPEDDKNGPGN